MKKLMLTCPHCSKTIPDKAIMEFRTNIENELQREFDKQKRALNSEIKLCNGQLAKFNREKDKVEIQLSLKIKEREEIIYDLKSKIDEARRRAESALTSQRGAGEAQELMLEELLRQSFQQDEIIEVKKGQSGADCIWVIKTESSHQIGTVIFESKNTKTFSEAWIDKLKTDNLKTKADALILVTKAMPKNCNSRFTIQDGVWIVAMEDVKELCIILRYALLKVQAFLLIQNKKQSHKEKLFDYLTSTAFRDSFESILDGFKKLQSTHLQEKAKLSLLWKHREQAIEQMLHQALNFYGTLQGVSGVEHFQDLQTIESPSLTR